MTVVHSADAQRGHHHGAVEIDRGEPHVVRERRRAVKIAGRGLLIEAVADHQPDGHDEHHEEERGLLIERIADHQPDRDDEHHDEEQHRRREQQDRAERAAVAEREQAAPARRAARRQCFSDRHGAPQPAAAERRNRDRCGQKAVRLGSSDHRDHRRTRTGTPTGRLRRGEAALVSSSKRHAIRHNSVASMMQFCTRAPNCRRAQHKIEADVKRSRRAILATHSATSRRWNLSHWGRRRVCSPPTRGTIHAISRFMPRSRLAVATIGGNRPWNSTVAVCCTRARSPE